MAQPAVLLGDLNSDADDPQIRRLLALPGVVDPVGQVLGREAPRRIDWIFLRGSGGSMRACAIRAHPIIPWLGRSQAPGAADYGISGPASDLGRGATFGAPLAGAAFASLAAGRGPTAAGRALAAKCSTVPAL